MRLLNEKEVAELLGVSVHLLRRQRVVGGGIPFVKIGSGGHRSGVRYEENAVEEFVRSRVKTSTSQY